MRNRKAEKKSSRAKHQASSSQSRSSASRDQGIKSFDRSSYVGQTSASGGDSRSVGAYSASNYGNSTRRGRRGSVSQVPSSPAEAQRRYAQNATSREFVRQQHERKRKSKRKKILFISLAVVCVLLIGGMGAAWAYISHLDSNLQENLDSDLLNALAVTDSASDPFYMLLIGADRSETRDASGNYSTYRTDTMILCRVDPQEKAITLISIPRDTQVELGEYGTQKINAAYAYGGASLAVEAVSDLAGVPISHYAEVDFDGFKAVVDALGGIEVDVPMEIDDDDAGGHLDAGLQTLNGEQALILCRSRHTYDDVASGDVIRAANQRAVLTAIVDKLMNSDIATITNTVSTLAEYVTTDYSVTGLVGLAQSMIDIDVSESVYTASVPTTSVYENNLWYEVVDEEEWETMMERVKQGLSPTEDTEVDEATGATLSSAGDGGSSNSDSSSSSSVSVSGVSVSVKNGCGIAGCADEAASKLTPEGITVTTGNADDYNYSTTIVVYEDSSQADQAEAIVDLLGVGKAVKNDGTYVFSGDFLVVVGADWG